MLAGRLVSIKDQIDRRTPESSHFIANERPDAFQTSIFDRTSSSSDTGPETPFDDKLHSTASTWGLGHDKVTIESPKSLLHRNTDFARPVVLPSAQFPPLSVPDDGYESDRESVAMTVQPSQRTVVPALASPISAGGAWETVKSRRQRVKPARLDLRNHRTTRVMEKQRYRDSAGAFRAVSKQAIDPRLSQETAHGFLDSPRSQSRGRFSGQSGAEIALAHISKHSPPPARGGGSIRDRSSSRRDVDRPRLTSKIASYAAAAAGTMTEPATGYWEQPRPATEPQGDSSVPNSSLEVRPPSSAIAALQKIPIEVNRSPSTPHSPNTPIPPYPPPPGFSYQQPYPTSDTAVYQIPGQYSQENLALSPDPYPSTLYPRKTGPIPYESLQPPSLSASPRKRDLPHDYSAWHSQTYSEILPPPAAHAMQQNLSLSSPNIRSSEGTYYPGRPEFSGPAHHDGYTSQPMSRDASGQSAQSHHSTHSENAADMSRRRPSLAETEPMPQLPVFSPRIPPTSYQVYERMRDERGWRGDRDRGLIRKSPRLGFARVSERLEAWNVLGEREK